MRKLSATPRVSIGGFGVRVHGANRSLGHLLESLWGVRGSSPRGSLDYAVVRTPAGTVLEAPDRRVAQLAGVDPIAIHAAVLEDVFSRIGDGFALHGACVARGGRGIVLSGPSGFGKTTLAIQLALRGFRFLSDDLLVVGRTDGIVEPVRRGIHLRPGSRSLLPAESRAKARAAARHRGREAWTVDPERWLGRPARCRGIAVVVLLRPPEDLHRVRRLHAFDLVFARGRARLPASLLAIGRLRAAKRSPDGRRWRVEAEDAFPIRTWIEGRPDGLQAWAKGASAAPRFDGPPAAAPIRRFQAAIELVQEMVNRGPASRLAAEYAGREQEIPVDLAARLAEARCYALVPGRLEETVDLVERLFAGEPISPRRPGRAGPR